MKYIVKNNPLNILLLFTILITFSTSQAQVIDKIIAKVDNQVVLKSELDQAYLQFMAQQQQQLKPGTDAMCSVFETLVINKMLLAKAELDSVVVDKETVDAELDRRMDHFVMQVGGDPKRLEEYYGKSLEDLKGELRKLVKEQMIIQKMQDKITGNVKVTPGEVKEFFNEIPKDSLPYFSTEIEVGHILLIPEITKEQKLAAKEKATKIRERIMAGEDFCELAKAYSEDLGSAQQCGDIGSFKKGDLVAPYEAAALSLKNGETSLVTESEYGYHIIQLIERRGNEFSSRHILIKPTTSSSDVNDAYAFLENLRSKILSDSISFEAAANKHSDDKQTQSTGGLFLDPSTGSSRIPMENIDPDIFFIVDTMKVGSISRPIKFKIDDQTEAVRIVYYKSKIPAHQANLKDDYQKIYKATLTEKKNNAINEWFDKTKHEVYIDIDPQYQNCELLITQ